MVDGFQINFNNSLNYKDSLIHAMSPTIKLISVISFLVMIFLPCGSFGQLILLALVLLIWILAHLSWHKMVVILKSAVFMFLVIFLINWIAFKMPNCVFNLSDSYELIGSNWERLHQMKLVNSYEVNGSVSYWACCPIWGGSVANDLVSVKPIYQKYIQGCISGQIVYLPYETNWYTLSSIVLISSINITMKIFLTITIVSILTSTTSMVQLTFAIEDILHPLKYLKFPVVEAATTISIAIRFVPSLLREASHIMDSQASRGMDFKNSKFVTKMKAIICLIVPLFSVAFKKADQLADALEVKNYNPQYQRTRYRNYDIVNKDWLFFIPIFFLTVVLICFVFWRIIIFPFCCFDIFLV